MDRNEMATDVLGQKLKLILLNDTFYYSVRFCTTSRTQDIDYQSLKLFWCISLHEKVIWDKNQCHIYYWWPCDYQLTIKTEESKT